MDFKMFSLTERNKLRKELFDKDDFDFPFNVRAYSDEDIAEINEIFEKNDYLKMFMKINESMNLKWKYGTEHATIEYDSMAEKYSNICHDIYMIKKEYFEKIIELYREMGEFGNRHLKQHEYAVLLNEWGMIYDIALNISEFL